jgi:hypothetical protein
MLRTPSHHVPFSYKEAASKLLLLRTIVHWSFTSQEIELQVMKLYSTENLPLLLLTTMEVHRQILTQVTEG